MESTTSPETTIGDARAALALADPSSAEPATETPAETTAPAATTQAAVEPTAPETASTEEPPKGEPPKWRWQDILANARETAAKEAAEKARQEFEQQHAGLKDFGSLSADERAGLLIWNRALKGDPEALSQVARVNPSLAQALGGKTATEPEPEPQPDAAIQLADGSTVPVFTPEGMKKREAWLQKQLESHLAEKFKPVLTTAEKLRQQEEADARQQQTLQWAQSILNPIKRLPYFEEFKPGIQKALAELPTDFTGQLEDVVVDTYAKLHAAKLDQLTKDGEAKALANLQQRAVAGTPNPATASTATPASMLGDARAALEHAYALER